MKFIKSKKQLVIWAMFFAILVFLFFFYLSSHKSGVASLEATTIPKYRYHAEKVTVPVYTSAMGSVVPKVSSILGAEIAGQITRIYFQQGQAIAANDVLADIQAETYLAELNGMKQRREGLKAQLTQRKDLFQRVDRLLKKEAATIIEWEKAKSEYLSTLAQVDAANEEVNAYNVRYGKTKIIAPYDGIIGKKMVEVGDFVAPGTSLFLVYTTGPMDVEFFVSERYLSQIHIGDQVTASIELSKKTTTATIFEIVPMENTQSRTFRIKATLDDYDSIHAGAFVRVQFPVGEQCSILIPTQAVKKVGQLEMVRVFENGVTTRRYVRTGDQIDGKVEVLSGLSGGEVVVYD